MAEAVHAEPNASTRHLGLKQSNLNFLNFRELESVRAFFSPWQMRVAAEIIFKPLPHSLRQLLPPHAPAASVRSGAGAGGLASMA